MKHLQFIALTLTTLIIMGCASKTTTIDHSNGRATAATIELPRFITALHVNDEEVVIPFMAGYPYFISVAEGPVTLTFIYTQDWGRSDSTRKRITSNTMSLNFQALAGNNYTVEYKKPPSISDPDNATQYVNHFNAWIASNGQQLTTAIDSGKSHRDLTQLLKQEPKMTSSDHLDELKRLWEAADATDRKEFMNWVISP